MTVLSRHTTGRGFLVDRAMFFAGRAIRMVLKQLWIHFFSYSLFSQLMHKVMHKIAWVMNTQQCICENMTYPEKFITQIHVAIFNR
jgi:hypothetical protein